MNRIARRDVLKLGALASGIGAIPTDSLSAADVPSNPPLTITDVVITPIALPDPPLLAAGGCHGPYFLRNVVQIETDAGIVGIGETKGGRERTTALNKCRELVIGKNAFAYESFRAELSEIDTSAYAGIELACLDAIGRATGRRVCELLGGPVRDEVEFAAYLFYRFAADHPKLINDERIVDSRGRDDKALDGWGDVTTPEAMAEMADGFQRKWGFRVFKLKAGVFDPDMELDSMSALRSKLGPECPLRIDPNARWTVPTALRIGRKLDRYSLEYYEDPVAGQDAMAKVRRKLGLTMSTNMCVTRFEHIPDAVRTEPIDVILADHHGWGGLRAFQEVGRMCETFGWGMSQHSNNHAGITMAAMTHIGAATPQLNYASDTHYVWLPEGADVIAGPNIPIRNGHIHVPDGPGLGVNIDLDKLARAHEVYQKCGMPERDDAATMRRVRPGWKRVLF